MGLKTPHTAALAGAAALSITTAAAAQPGHTPPEGPPHVNLHRVRILVEGDVRALWLGDSWSRMENISRLPFGALCVWPLPDITALAIDHNRGNGLSRSQDYTLGPGSLTEVGPENGWRVEVNNGAQAYFALPLDSLTYVVGTSGLVLTGEGFEAGRIQSLGINNARFRTTDHGEFSAGAAAFRGRALYYAPANTADVPPVLGLQDWWGTDRGRWRPAVASRPKWHLGADPDADPPAAPTPSQINAAPFDITLQENLGSGPRLAIAEDPDEPFVGSDAFWAFAGAVIYRVDDTGARAPGYYHTGLSHNSWTFRGHGLDQPSTGGKVFSDEQLLHWLDVTTIDRDQPAVVILHMDTEGRDRPTYEAQIRDILRRYRAAFAAIGAPAPRFLLIGSYMHNVFAADSIPESRTLIERLDSVYEELARAEPDCAFFSLYRATDGTFLTSDQQGGPGAQQAARDWLDSNGWSTITFGNAVYNLSSAEDGGLDGVLVNDGLHLGSTPAAAFYAKLLGDAIAAASCPADFNGDGTDDTRDVLDFLNAWIAGEPEADFNGDGVVDTRDVLDFLNAWTLGC